MKGDHKVLLAIPTPKFSLRRKMSILTPRSKVLQKSHCKHGKQEVKAVVGY